jgi:hypothetical protein
VVNILTAEPVSSGVRMVSGGVSLVSAGARMVSDLIFVVSGAHSLVSGNISVVIGNVFVVSGVVPVVIGATPMTTEIVPAGGLCASCSGFLRPNRGYLPASNIFIGARSSRARAAPMHQTGAVCAPLACRGGRGPQDLPAAKKNAGGERSVTHVEHEHEQQSAGVCAPAHRSI